MHLSRALGLVLTSLTLTTLFAACSDSADGPNGGTTTGTELDASNVDGGDGASPGKPPGATCVTDDECATDYCDADCREPPPNVHQDGRRNGGETGVDCGGTAEPACPLGQGCATDDDCTSDYCDNTLCAAPSAGVHQDGRRNGGETGVDCGGAAPLACAGGQPCKTSDDCLSTCNAQLVCNEISATDGKKNGDETDIDCGGSAAPKCLRTKACVKSSDCQLAYCKDAVCSEPTSKDGVQNGAETGVDCGGGAVTEDTFSYTAPRCKDDAGCAVDGDCITGACSPGGVCVAKSCDTAETAGIVTCGKGEVPQADKQHETCCRSLQLPTRTTRRLDRYEITSGRMRSFINAVGPDVRSWVNAYITANPKSPLDATKASQLAALKALNANTINLFPSQKRGAPLNLVAHMGIDADPYDGIRGCYNGAGSYGHNTYWQDPADLADYGIPARPMSRSESDQKSLNCAMPIMYMAFCAWDGGELAMLADHTDAWPTTQAFPWGTTDSQRPNYNWCNGSYKTGGFTCQDTATFPANANTVAGVFYEWPLGMNPANDQEMWIAAPGRFSNDATSRKSVTGDLPWQDLFANLEEYTGDLAASSQDFCDFTAAPLAGATTCTDSKKPGQTGTRYTNIPTVGMPRGRSWEGHVRANGGTFVATFQYGKFGARCVRPAQ